MEGDHVKETKKKIKDLQGVISDAGNVFSTLWVRLPFQAHNGAEWIILDSRRGLLLHFRMFLAVLYCAVQIFKQF